MATTPNGLKYPTDYADPADSPAALEDLALTADAAITLRAMAARRIDTTAPLTGGGTLESNRVLAITPGYYARVFVQSSQPSAGNIGDIWVPT
jgi:hypothetical protein